ncbi:MAG: hypothetical protein QW793_04710 [Candidatus Caldarchaeum sp.]
MRRCASEATLSPYRLRRLCQLVHMLATRKPTRQTVSRQLYVDERTFYRDLTALEQLGVSVVNNDGRYCLTMPLNQAMQHLPLPDPKLTVADAMRLARGRSASHRKLASFIKRSLGVMIYRDIKNHHSNHVRRKRKHAHNQETEAVLVGQ